MTNNADGTFGFDAIEYGSVGTYVYVVKEVEGGLAGISYDDTLYEVTVVVENINGELVPTITAAKVQPTTTFDLRGNQGDTVISETLEFTNSYIPESIKVELSGEKTMTGRNLAEDEFSFQLVDAEGKVLQTVKNDADGNFLFEELMFEAAGTYKYQISEVMDAQENVVYDATVYTVTVVVTKDETTGVLNPAVTIDNGGKLAFHNTYDPDTVPVVITGKKVLVGRPMVAGEFKFILNQKGNPVPMIAWNDAFGNFHFNLTFSEVGEYHYTVREVNGGANGMTSDNAVYYFTVVVTDPGTGELEAKIIFTDASRNHVINVNKMTFRNIYTPNPTSVKLEGSKTLEGRTLKQGEFTFQLKDQAGKVLQTVKNAADGTISFADLRYQSAGSYTYTVTEVKGDDEAITYDDTVHKVTVVVTDNNGDLRAVVKVDQGGKLAFTNKYEPEPTEPEPTEPEPTEPEPAESEPTVPATTESEYDDVPGTRDNNKVLLWAMLAGFGMIGMVAFNPFKRKGRYCR